MGVVGTPDGIARFRAWARTLRSAIRLPPAGRGEVKRIDCTCELPGHREPSGSRSRRTNAASVDPPKDIDRATRILIVK